MANEKSVKSEAAETSQAPAENPQVKSPAAPLPADENAAEPASIPADAAAQQELGVSLNEITQSFANNQGYPCADGPAAVNGDIVINTPNGMKKVRDLALT